MGSLTGGGIRRPNPISEFEPRFGGRDREPTPQEPASPTAAPDKALEFPCAPTVKELLKNPAVKSALNQAWSDSQAGTPTYHEEGGWIYANNSNNSLSIIRAASGTSNSMPSMRPSLTPIVFGSRLAAWFHTHPRGTASASEADKSVSRTLGVPGITKYSRKGTFTIGRIGDHVLNPVKELEIIMREPLILLLLLTCCSTPGLDQRQASYTGQKETQMKLDVPNWEPSFSSKLTSVPKRQGSQISGQPCWITAI